jgi:hypothetical protein
MPSPFPGMDPYLESPDWFPNLHDDLIFCLKELLQSRLPEPYYIRSRQRIWLEFSHRPIEPDIEVLRTGPEPRRSEREREHGGVALAEVETAVFEPIVLSVETIEHEPYEEPFLEIRRRQGTEDRLVTSMEILSLSNKTAGNPGHEKYLTKQREILGSQVNLVEIDLLRGGTHATALPKQLAVGKTGPFDYHISVHRFDRPNDYFVYPIALEQRLPAIAIPLLPGDPDIPFDLQAGFDRAYDAGPYQRVIRYGVDPIIPPLSPERAEWAAALITTQKSH